MPCHRRCCCCWYHGCQGTCVCRYLQAGSTQGLCPSPALCGAQVGAHLLSGCSHLLWVPLGWLWAWGSWLWAVLRQAGGPSSGIVLPCQRAESKELSIHGAIQYSLAGERPGDQGITPRYTQTEAEGNHSDICQSSWFSFGAST